MPWVAIRGKVATYGLKPESPSTRIVRFLINQTYFAISPETYQEEKVPDEQATSALTGYLTGTRCQIRFCISSEFLWLPKYSFTEFESKQFVPGLLLQVPINHVPAMKRH